MSYNPSAGGSTQAFGTVVVSGQSNVVADAAPDTLTLVAGANVTLTTDATGDSVTIAASGAGLADGDKGDITVSGSGATWTIDNGAVTLAKMADMATDSFLGRDTAGTGAPEVLSVATAKTLLGLTGTNSGDVTLAGALDYLTLSGQEITRGAIDLTTDVTGDLPLGNLAPATATDKVLGRSTAGAGDWEEIACTAAGRALLDDADAAAQRATLGAAPADPSYLVVSSHSELTGERIVAQETGVTLLDINTPGAIYFKIATNGISDAKFRQSAGLSVVGRSADSTGNVADITAANDGEVLRRSGTTLGFGTVGTVGLGDGIVTYAKLQDVSATSRVLGRKTAGAGDAEECTLSEVLDFVGSAAQGDLLYRGASGWTRLGAGTAGNLLQTGGAGANPSWTAPPSGGTAATQSDQETATSTTTFVSPGRQQFHPSAAKFWVKATGNSTTIVASYNMTSWADTGVGDADGTIATDFSSAAWCGNVSVLDSTLAWDTTYTEGYGFDAMTAGTFGVKCGKMQDGGTAAATVEDPDSWMVMGFGDQA